MKKQKHTETFLYMIFLWNRQRKEKRITTDFSIKMPTLFYPFQKTKSSSIFFF